MYVAAFGDCAVAEVETNNKRTNAMKTSGLFMEISYLGIAPRVSAAKRRKNVATAEGRGLEFQANEPRSGGRLFRRCAAHLPSNTVTTAFSRGYILSPLRGRKGHTEKAHQLKTAPSRTIRPCKMLPGSL